MGSPDARAYSRNKRGIAGSPDLDQLRPSSLLNLIQKCAGTFVADMDEIRPQYSQTSATAARCSRPLWFALPVPRSGRPSTSSTPTLPRPARTSRLATPWYSDQVLPFDITLSGANEYGAMCAARIFGVEILNEGCGISIDDAVSEMQATFVARVVEPMSAVASPFQSAIGGSVLNYNQVLPSCRQQEPSRAGAEDRPRHGASVIEI